MSNRNQTLRRRASVSRGGWLVACALLASAPAGASIRSAQEAYRAGRFEAARAEYERLLQGRPEDPRLAFNAGTAAFRAGDPESAARHFESATLSRDLGLQAEAFYNLGNSRYLQAEAMEDPSARRPLWEEAARHFATTLSIDPAHADARANLELVRSRLAGQPPPPAQQPQPSPENQDPQSGDEEGSDEQKGQQGGQDPQEQQGQEGQEGQQGGKGEESQGRPEGGKERPGDGQEGGEKQDGRASESDPRGSKDPDTGREPGQDGSGKQGDGREPSPGEGRDGKDGRDGDAGRVRAAGSPRGAAGEGEGQGMSEGAGAPGEVVRMTVRQAEQVLDEQRGEERALIWRPAQTPPESRASGMRRKTW